MRVGCFGSSINIFEMAAILYTVLRTVHHSYLFRFLRRHPFQYIQGSVDLFFQVHNGLNFF